VSQQISQFQVPVKNFIFEEVMEAIDDFAKYLNGLFFSEILAFFDVSVEITIVTILENKVVVVGSFLHVIELNDVMALTALQYLYFTLQ
jgi:hypothetical protein